MNFIESPIRVPGNARPRVGDLRCFRPPALSNIVDAIWDCDIPDADFARRLTIKCAPSTGLWLLGQYRTPAVMRQGTSLLPMKCATQIRSHTLTLCPTGALGVILVCLRAASRIVGAPLRAFAKASVHLESLFRPCEVATCDDMLAGARKSEDRISGIHSFLLRHLRSEKACLASKAALYLRNDPTMQIHSLAASVGCSARHLARVFDASFGISPKRFARLARFQKILRERQRTRSWVQIAHSCGLTDQAHLVREFQDIVGESPTEFFTHELPIAVQGMNEANLIIQRSDQRDVSATEH